MEKHQNKIDGKRFRFVLSAGRVGTTSLREYLKENVRNIDVAFEPKSSRRAFMLWNLEQYFNLNNSRSEAYMIKQRYAEFKKIKSGYNRIEINPFATPFCDVLSKNVENMHVVHIIRHPYTWVKSIMKFRALGWNKYIIDSIPFTRIRHSEAKEFWSSLTELEKFAWRWRLHNEQIIKSIENYTEYKLIKYEDLSLGDESVKLKCLTDVLNVLIPDFKSSTVDINRLGKFNASGSSEISVIDKITDHTRENIYEICKPLMDKFSYSDHY